MRRLAPLLALLIAADCSAPPPPAPPDTPVVVTLGDSVPAGAACGCDPFPDLYARMLSPTARAVNLAEPGDTSADVLDTVEDDGVRTNLRRATVVLIMAGANDLAEAFDSGRNDAAYQAAAGRVEVNVAATVAAVVQAHGEPVPVLVLGYWNVVKDGTVGLADYGPVGLAAAHTATRYCDQALRRAAFRSGAEYVPTTAAFRGEHRAGDPTGLLAADGDHPNADGQQAIAEAVYAARPAG